MTDALPDPPASVPEGDALAAALARAGLDQLWPFDVAWLGGETRAALEVACGTTVAGRALLVANSRALWPHLLRAVSDERARTGSVAPHPLQRYVDAQLSRAIAARPGARAVASHDGPPYVPMQRIAAESGFGWPSPAHLIVHATLGPWVALRAVIVGLGEAQLGARPEPAPCTHCDEGCAPAFEAARGSGDWRDWLAVREACPLGRTWRYSDAQSRYHYTKDLRALAE
ncbi:MAG: hypothetical protein KC503_34545 [Myxococcales bacterium]|nr:hypothetical protein [Myxococcales bacterium]